MPILKCDQYVILSTHNTNFINYAVILYDYYTYCKSPIYLKPIELTSIQLVNT